jgi:hypothetical protein
MDAFALIQTHAQSPRQFIKYPFYGASRVFDNIEYSTIALFAIAIKA